MRKFLLPIINLVNVVLVSIAWGLSGKTAVIDAARSDAASGNIYQVIWEGEVASHNVNAMGIVGFFLFILACVLMLLAFIPFKARKFTTCLGGLSFIAGGVLFLNAPWHAARAIYKPELTGAIIAIAVLLFIAGAFTLVMSIIEFFEKKTQKLENNGSKQAKKLTKVDKLHICFASIAVALSIFIVIFSLCKFVIWLCFVYLAIMIAYVVWVFVVEYKKNKAQGPAKVAKKAAK